MECENCVDLIKIKIFPLGCMFIIFSFFWWTAHCNMVLFGGADCLSRNVGNKVRSNAA